MEMREVIRQHLPVRLAKVIAEINESSKNPRHRTHSLAVASGGVGNDLLICLYLALTQRLKDHDQTGSHRKIPADAVRVYRSGSAMQFLRCSSRATPDRDRAGVQMVQRCLANRCEAQARARLVAREYHLFWHPLQDILSTWPRATPGATPPVGLAGCTHRYRRARNQYPILESHRQTRSDPQRPACAPCLSVDPGCPDRSFGRYSEGR